MADRISIKDTWIGTSDPLNICEGIALFPPFPNIGAGVHVAQDTHALIDKNLQLLAVRAQATIDWGVFFGLCGPGMAINFHAHGDILPEQKELALIVKNDDTKGGYSFGTNISVGFGLLAKVYKLHWKGWHLQGAWDAVLNANLALSFDFLKLAFDVIAAALTLKPCYNKLSRLSPR